MPKLNAFGIVVADMAASVAFYRRLGLEFPPNAETEGHVEVTLDGGMRLLFDTIEVIQRFTHYEPASGGHRMGLAFACSSPTRVDEVYASLTSAGATSLKEPWDAFWGQRYAQIQDPDGNPVDLFAPLG
jgi:uncharacterized glyoxalase superfamily protein PhnB